MSKPSSTLIYDRTQADVTNATTKGQFNASDLNRIEEWCSYLAETLTTLGYPVTITTKTNWVQTDMRTETQMSRVRNNIVALVNAYYSLTHTVETQQYFNYIKCNNWEKILSEIDTLISGMTAYYIDCGVANCGQVRVYQNRFRRY